MGKWFKPVPYGRAKELSNIQVDPALVTNIAINDHLLTSDQEK